MPQPSVIHATAIVEKSYAKPVSQVFAALSDPAKKRRWYAERSGPVDTYEIDFRTGGSETLIYRLGENTPFPGARLTTLGTIQDIVPNQRVVITSSTLFGDKCISASLVTFELLATPKGCDLICTHQDAFFEGSDGPELRAKGWRDLLSRLDDEVLA